jgi:hypothetical protein
LQTAGFHNDFVGEIFLLDLFEFIDPIGCHRFHDDPVIDKVLLAFLFAVEFEVDVSLFGDVDNFTPELTVFEYESVDAGLAEAGHTED